MQDDKSIWTSEFAGAARAPIAERDREWPSLWTESLPWIVPNRGRLQFEAAGRDFPRRFTAGIKILHSGHVGGVESYLDDGILNSNVSIHPYFEFNVPRNVTTAVGQTAFLHCRVEQLGDKAVSWIRKRDLHILTAGILTYTSDQRFQVIRPDKSDNWTLQIKFPQIRDSGIYECQVNTEPKMSLPFRLNVVEAKAKILGPSDIHVKAGSSITLTCIIKQGPHDLGTVFWYRGADILDVSPHPNELAGNDRITIQNHWTDGLTSQLHISSATIADSGNYSCVPTIAAPTSVDVHVINEEHPAAMQHGNKNTASLSLHCTLVYSITVMVIKLLR